MLKFIVQMIDAFTGKVLSEEDEEFDNYEDAEEYALECHSDYSAGADVLDLAGRAFGDPDDVEFVVDQVER